MRKISLALRHILVSALTTAIAVGPAAPRAFAEPRQVRGGNVAPGIVQNTGTNEWTITAPNGAIIHYSSFNISGAQNGQPAETVIFVQPGADSRVLNRILSAAPTHIDGNLQANGHVYIVNPAGVFFGDGAQVNVTELQAAAGHLSDRDFERGEDHFTGLRGRVENAGQITANAVSLVGGQVANSGEIRAEGGWIVMAAGRDVLIGREDGQGVLLRVEGARDAVFKPLARGVENTGQLNTSAADGTSAGRVSLGAGDLYGTAIFSNNAIEARRIALQADNRGDIALGGTVKADTLDVTFAGDKAGTLAATGPAGVTETINANTVNLLATGAKGDLKVGDGLAFRGLNLPANGPTTVNVEQKKALKTANLAGLDLGSQRENTSLNLKATNGQIVVDDRAAVTGTRLDLEALGLIDVRGRDSLVVDTLRLHAATTLTDADLIATGSDRIGSDGVSHAAIEATTNIGFFSVPASATDPSAGALLSAHGGTLQVTGDITTSNGGALRLEAKDVKLGSFDEITGGVRGGVIDASGSIPPRVEIGFSNEAGQQQTNTVSLNAIHTLGHKKKEGDAPVAGGDVIVNATGDVTVHGSITTKGEAAASSTQPALPGGSVHIATSGAGATIRVGAITTGGGDPPPTPAPGGPPAPEHGDISLTASNVAVTGNLNAFGGTIANADGSRDRSVTVKGKLELGADSVSIVGGDVKVTGTTVAGRQNPSDPSDRTLRKAGLRISGSGTTTLGDEVTLDSLAIDNLGGDVVFGGNVTADTSVAVTFDTAGTGVWRSGGGVVAVKSNHVELAASRRADTTGTTAGVSLDPNLHFVLVDRPDVPATAADESARGSFSLKQDAALTAATTDGLFTPDRFSVVTAPGAAPTPGLAGETVALRTHSLVSLDAHARTSLAGTDLTIAGASFETAEAGSDLNLASLDLGTLGALDANFAVTAEKSITLRSGLAGAGNLTVSSNLHADSVVLAAGDGAGGDDTATVVFTPTAQLRASNGTNAKQVVIVQDAALNTAALPDAIAFGDGADPLAGLDYQLESRAGVVTLNPGEAGKIAGTNLTLTGQRGVTLGDSVPLLASLSARTPEALDVTSAIATAPGGKIELHAGTDGSGDLTISSTLAAVQIDLIAGNGSAATARVVLQDGALFTSAGSGAAAPTHFGLEQDAGIGANGSGTQIPTAARFGGAITGMEYALRSRGASVRIGDPSLVAGSALQLLGKTGVTVPGDLDLASLDVTGALTLGGDVTTSGNLALHDSVTLNGASPGNSTVPRDQTLVAHGDLTAAGPISKSTAGAVTLHADKALEVGSVTNAHQGAALVVEGGTSVKTGLLDTSGGTQLAGGAVTVTSSGAIDVGGIDAHGSAGRAQTSGSSSTSSATDGSNGGQIDITGSQITAGTISSAAGPGGAPLANHPGTTTGGKGGNITVTANGGLDVIRLKSNLIADGGAGGSGTPADGPAGDPGDVTLAGSVQLLASRGTTDTATNVIHGNHVTIAGGVGAGTETGDVGVGFTGLTVVAKNELAVGGDLAAGVLDLELHNGDLALSSSRVTHLSADQIRLAASDGHGGNTTSVVDLSRFAFTGANGIGPVNKVTLEQDAGFGGTFAGGTDVPNLARFDGTGGRVLPFTFGLVSQDGAIVLNETDIANVRGTNLLLAANGAADAPPDLDPIRITGAELQVHSLTLGTATGVGGKVGGDTSVSGSLQLGTDRDPSDPNGPDTLNSDVLTAFGDLDVAGDARMFGRTKFEGAQTQTLHAGGTLTLKGGQNLKTSTGDLVIDSKAIALTSVAPQVIANDDGALQITSPLVKLDGDLALRGVTEDDSRRAIVVNGTTAVGGFALATQNGNLRITASTRPATPGALPGVGIYAIDGDLLALGGNLTVLGRGELVGGKSSYKFEAARDPSSGKGGELTVGGIAGTDGDLMLIGRSQPATADVPHPAAVHLQGKFDLTHSLSVDGTTELLGDTTISADGDVTFASLIEGASGLDVTSHGAVAFYDDVALTAGAFGARGDGGVLFVSTSDNQAIDAGSISLGNGAKSAAKGKGSLLRDGSLRLAASNGDVVIGRGQRMIVNGDLSVSATRGTVLADTAALGIAINSHDLTVYSGSTIAANSIATSARPKLSGGGGATFAVPTRTEVSSNVPSDEILVRALTPTGALLAFPSAPDEPFDPAFPTVNGAALFDFAREIPQWQPREPLTRPHVDPIDLDAAVRVRPLWAEELIAYLELRSLESPERVGRPADAELLPPVGARPGEELRPSDARVRIAAVENAVAAYRDLFRAELRRDPESGVIEGPDQSAAIRAAFQAPIDVLRREHAGHPVAGADAAKLVASDASFASARRYQEQLGTLLDLGQRALMPDQRPRFRALMLAEVTPYGISPAEFQALFGSD